VIATARFLKLGRKLAVVEVGMRSVSSSELVAHASVTYSIPSEV
jgi:acyl-coenzyme A thioesterase PaaI-like protein